MKVVLKARLIDRILADIKKAQMEGREIEHIELTAEEKAQVARELGFSYVPYDFHLFGHRVVTIK